MALINNIIQYNLVIYLNLVMQEQTHTEHFPVSLIPLDQMASSDE